MPENRQRSTLSRTTTSGVGLAVMVFALWASWFIFQSSFLVSGSRVFCLFDDAMISMDYARNLTEHHGLRWGRYGDRVEGFTTPLWTLLMIPWNSLPVALRLRSLGVQVMSALLLVVNLLVFSRLARKHFTPPEMRSSLPGVVLLASFYPLSYWSLMGMESGLQALLVTLAVLLALDLRHHERTGLYLFVVFAVSYLVRMDMSLMIVATCLFLWVTGSWRGRTRVLRIGSILLGTVVGGYQLFRMWYFGDALPNTYYLKLTGIPLVVRLERGLATFGDFLWANTLALALFLVVPWLVRRRWTEARWVLPALLVCIYCAYSVWVGGDAWEMHNNIRANRFIVFVLPLLFLPWNFAMCCLMSTGRRRVLGVAGAAALTTLLFLLLNGLVLSERSRANWKNLAVSEKPLLVTSNALVFRSLRKLEGLLAPGALIVTYWAGIPAYFSDYRLVDAFGYNNRYVARQKGHVSLSSKNFRDYTPGHVKWDEDYLLEAVQPDAFFQAWTISPVALEKHGYRKVGEFWLRTTSPYVRPEARTGT